MTQPDTYTDSNTDSCTDSYTDSYGRGATNTDEERLVKR